MCYTKTFNKTRCWQTLWLRRYRAVNLKARVSELSIDGGEMSKIDSFSGHNLFWYSVNCLLWCGFTVRCAGSEGFGFNLKAADRAHHFDCWGSLYFRKVKGPCPIGIHWVVGRLVGSWNHSCIVVLHDSTKEYTVPGHISNFASGGDYFAFHYKSNWFMSLKQRLSGF